VHRARASSPPRSASAWSQASLPLSRARRAARSRR
jgi:hypothetical protein